MYTGYKEFMYSDEYLANFYTNPEQFSNDFYENEYLLLQNLDGMNIDKFCFQHHEFRKVKYPTIENHFMNSIIKPRNEQQVLAMDMLQDRTSKVKIIRGVYGSGKDFLMLNQALDYIESNLFEKIVFIRPNVTVANVPEIGFLKGDIDDKLGWTLAPFYDKVGGQEGIDYLIHGGKLEVAPLLFIRGRSFENSIIYVCEGQNITTEIAKLLLGRVGEGSEIWINGDTHQTDKRVYEADNGITKMIEKLSGNPLFAYIYLPKTERSNVANLANLLDDEED